MKKIALLTSGGDAPRMNAAIRSVVKTCLHYQIIPYGIYDGYLELVEGCGKVLIPEEHTDIEKLAHDIRHIYKGRRSMISLVAEGDDAGNALDVMNKVKPFL